MLRAVGATGSPGWHRRFPVRSWGREWTRRRGAGPDATGGFFQDSTLEAIGAAVEVLEAGWRAGHFDRDTLQAQARRFQVAAFVEGLQGVVAELAPHS